MSKQPNAHSEIGASSFYRYSACPASVALSRGLPERESEDARIGTLAHEIAALELEKASYLQVTDQELEMRLGELWLELINDEDTKESVQAYVDYALELINSIPKKIVLIEHRFDLSEIYPGCFGTADLVVVDLEKKKLYMIDYKNGAGIRVNAWRNPQLMFYALGVFVSLKNIDIEEVELTIVQPRMAYNDEIADTYVCKIGEVVDFYHTLLDAAYATQDPEASTVAGDHCTYCLAAPRCPEITKKALEVKAMSNNGKELIPLDKLPEILTWLPVFKKWIERLEKYALAEAQDGKVIEGFKVIAGRGRREWRSEQEVIDYFTAIGVSEEDLFETKKTFLSPNKLEKAAKNLGIDKKDVNSFIQTRLGAPKLVPNEVKGDPIITTAEQAFGKGEEA